MGQAPLSDKEIKEKIEDFKLKCRQAWLRVTPQRLEIYKALIQSKEHPSAEAVYQKVKKTLSSISLDTVNRTLLTLSEIGAAFVIEGSGDPKRFDGNMEGHQHFKCVQCRRVIDFYHPPFENIKVPASISRKHKVLRKTVYLEGVCDMCLKRRPFVAKS